MGLRFFGIWVCDLGFGTWDLGFGIFLRQRRIEADAAARLVRALRAEQHAVTTRDQALRVVGGIAAHHADRERLGDVLGNRQQLRHRFERLAEIILVEAGDDDALTLIRKLVTDRGQILVEELPFVDADDLRVRLDEIQQRAGAADRARRNPHLAVRDDVIVGVPGVDGRLEDLDFLASELGAAQPADQLFALPAEHAANDDFDPALIGLMPNDVHA